MSWATVDSVETMQALMFESPYTEFLGLVVEEFDAASGMLRVSMKCKPELERGTGAGQLHGGPIAGMVDTVAACLVAGMIGNGVPTINFRVDYIRPATSTLRAVATARRVGRSIAICDVDVFNEQQKLVAVGRGTFGVSRP